MPVTRHNESFSRVIEWTDEITELDNQYGLLNSMGLFDTKPTSQTAIIFDKNTNNITLLPDADRSARQGSYGKDRSVETFSLPLAYFDHQDNITPEDIQGWRRPGTPDDAEALDRVRAEKMVDLRLAVDQTHEYMKIQAIKGVTTTPEGTVLADMFTEFGVTQVEVDLDLGNATVNLDAKFNAIKRAIGANLKGLPGPQGIDILIDPDLFDRLIDHPKLREVYLSSQSNVRYQQDLAEFMQWGVTDTFSTRGLRFMSYDATFTKPDGSTEAAFTDEGYAVPRVRGLFRGYVGPSNKLSGANRAGSPMFAFEYRDPKDEYHEMQVQTAPLFFITRPLCSVKIVSNS